MSVSKLALQFSSQNEHISTTMFSSSYPHSVLRNVEWHGETMDAELVAGVQEVLEPVMNKQWIY